MSRVFHRQDAWWIDYSCDGKRYRKRIGHSKRLAEDALKVIENDIVQKRYTPERYSKGRNFSEIADLYWDVKGKLKAKNYKYMFREVRNRFGDRPAGAISPSDVQRFYNEVVERASVSTANRNLVFLGSIFRWAIKFEHYYGKNPCAPIEKRKEPNHRTRYLTIEEIGRLLAACHPRLRPVVACALSTGMRCREILGLRWENVDMQQGIIHVLKSKTGMSRHIQMRQSLRLVLESLGPKEEGFVFNLPYIMLRRYFAKALEIAGIKHFRFHDTRHTFASWFAMSTNDIGTLREFLGHQNIQMTMRYAHLCAGHHTAKLADFEKAVPIEPAPKLLEDGTSLALAKLTDMESPQK